MKSNPSNNSNISFLNSATDEIIPSIWPFLEQGLWKQADAIAFEDNTVLGVLKRGNWKPVIKDIISFYQGMRWDAASKSAYDPTYIPKLAKTDWDTVLSAASNFFKKYQDKQIGVQLSGGLDSSIIIGLLSHLNIPFWLVGMTTKRYEFRTERHIQELLFPLASDAILLDYNAHLPLSELLEVPPHQHPELLSINYSSENAMALACEQLGIEVLLTGDGGDNLFAEALPDDQNLCPWIPQVFSDPWPAEYVYGPKGVELIPFFADEGFMDAIYNLRRGQPEDNSKWWARKFFERILPSELVQYDYCADFWGLYISGMQAAIPTIKWLFDQAYDLTGNSLFSPKSTAALFSQDLLDAKKEMYQRIESRTAFAVWLHGLKKAGIAS
jgi:hypothetical protein